uniref:Gag-Pol polyprotein n=1 Tax=Tanacetum cinerariifolium TaxID=118510 RepID=A0A6L2LNE5_TANCI|nr:hypothetical protein [Tanacetum cinerariifolium]
MVDHPSKIATETSEAQLARRRLETYLTMSEEKKKLIDAEAEVVHIILTGIDNDIYSSVDAYPNAIEMWKSRLMQGENINKQDVETNLFCAFGKFTSREGNQLNHTNPEVIPAADEATRTVFEKEPLEQEGRALLASLIKNMKLENESKKMNTSLRAANTSLTTELESYKDIECVNDVKFDSTKAYGLLEEHRMNSKKSVDAYELKFYKKREENEIEKVIGLEKQVKVLNDIVECDNLETELSNSKTQRTDKLFANLEQHCIHLELALQHEKEINVSENSSGKQSLISGNNEKV